MLQEHLRRLLRHLAVGRAAGLRYRHHVAVEIGAATAANVDEWIEAAEDHALAVERHLRHLLHARIGHHLFVRGVARRLVGVLHPAEDHGLIRGCLDRALEIVELALGNIVAPGLDHAVGTEFLEHRQRLAGMFEIGLPVGGGHGDYEALQVHGGSPVRVGWRPGSRGRPARDWGCRRHGRAGPALKSLGQSVIKNNYEVKKK